MEPVSDRDDSPQLASDLRNLYRPGEQIPDVLRDEIMHEAKTGLGDLGRTRRWGGLAVIAAAITIVFGLQFLLQELANPDRDKSPITAAQLAKQEDIDGNGRVDILDAFVLAKQIGVQSTLNATWDINGDGVVDRKDVDAIAQTAVRINGGA